MNNEITLTPWCPFMNDVCKVSCMLYLKEADSSVTYRENTIEGSGCCGLAALASHVASKTHNDKNYLMPVVHYTM